jgi:hypothetical protein
MSKIESDFNSRVMLSKLVRVDNSIDECDDPVVIICVVIHYLCCDYYFYLKFNYLVSRYLAISLSNCQVENQRHRQSDV